MAPRVEMRLITALIALFGMVGVGEVAIPITVVSTTSAQVVLTYDAPDPASCALEVSESPIYIPQVQGERGV